jgi:hypothetical protein
VYDIFVMLLSLPRGTSSIPFMLLCTHPPDIMSQAIQGSSSKKDIPIVLPTRFVVSPFGEITTIFSKHADLLQSSFSITIQLLPTLALSPQKG